MRRGRMGQEEVQLIEGDKAERVSLTERIALSPDEASALSGIGVTRIREAAASGMLKAHKHGRRTIILRDNLIDWIRGMPKAARMSEPSDSRKASAEAPGRRRGGSKAKKQKQMQLGKKR